jgi:trk system potassium uptake protein TrkA
MNPSKQARRTVVVGCGRLGSVLAGRLSASGCEVVVVDRREDAFERLAPEFAGSRLCGDAAEVAVMREAGMDRADCVLATTESDTVNLLVAEVARTWFRVPRVIVRVFDPRRESIYEASGLEVVSPTTLTAEAFLAALTRPAGGGA